MSVHVRGARAWTRAAPMALVVSAALLAPPSPAAADNGAVRINCLPTTSERSRVDPLEHYGVSPTAHLHTPAGAKAFSARTTLKRMLAAPSSCEVSQDHSLLWIPTPLRRDGQPAKVMSIDYYLANAGYHISRTPPNGLRFLGGDPMCEGDLCPAIYLCTSRAGKAVALHTIPTHADHCQTRTGLGYTMVVYSSGQCWRGGSLGSGLGDSGPPALLTASRPCPGQVIPQIEAVMEVGANGLGGYLSSDVVAGTARTSPGSTGHFDYVFGWKRGPHDDPLTSIIHRCLDVRHFTAGQGSCAAVPGPGGQNASVYQLNPRTGLVAAGSRTVVSPPG